MSSLNQKQYIFYVELVIISFTGLGGLLSLISVCVRRCWISDKFIEAVHMHTNYQNLTRCETSCLLAIIGTICSEISALFGVMRMYLRNVKKIKRCKTAQFIYLIAGFISLLSSVAVWADFLRHLPHEIGASYHLKKFTLRHRNQLLEEKKKALSRDQLKNPLTRLTMSNRSIPLYRNYENMQIPAQHIHLSVNYLFGWAYWFCVVAVVFLFLSNLIYLMRKDCEEQKQSTEVV
uniref:G_PROTEIN_RECEP_F1_2 domain-containing protein n=1 Tax=Trichobilharzia regenti TaxID=157069 RepID=A0AA85JPP8_TRIRE|nr:unnamed protein product [Trichobilharzia regenti]